MAWKVGQRKDACSTAENMDRRTGGGGGLGSVGGS
jgi:hypothetical protein